MRIAIALLLAAVPIAGLAQTVVSTTPLGEVPTTHDSKYYMSPDGQHVGIVKSRGSRRLVSIDGTEGEPFDSIEYITRSEYAGSPNAASMVVFSPDGKRYAYGARRAGEAFVVVDGKTYPEGREFVFSPDSSRFAYVTGKPGTGAVSVVLDGTAGPRFNDVRELMFSSDGKRFIYVAHDGAWKVVVDGKQGPGYGSIVNLQLPQNGSRYAYLVEMNGEFVPVIDGVVQTGVSRGTSLGPPQLRLSADGRRWGFVTMSRTDGGYSERAVVDGKAGEGYLRVEELQFSPDSKRFGYVATTGEPRNTRTFLVIDGKRVGLEYRSINHLQFSPDGKRFAGLAMSDAGAFVVIDGEESEAFTHQVTDFRFSATGRYAYVGRPKAQGKTQAFVDGKPQGEIDEIMKNTLTFSPDGTRLIYSAVKRYPERLLFFDGKIEPMGISSMGTNLWKDPVVFSPNGKHVAFMGNGEGPANLYVDMQPGVAGYHYAMPTFSADGQHFAVAGREPHAKKWSVFVNGKAVTELDDLVQQPPAGTWKFGSDGKLHAVAIQGGQFQRVVVDPQGSSVESFAANMSKSGKTGGASGKSGASQVAGGANAAGGATSGVADPADAVNKKAKEALDRLKKLKGILGGKDKD
jgi:hypothetical protein